MNNKRVCRYTILLFIPLFAWLTLLEADAQNLPPSTAASGGAELSIPPADLPVLENSLGDVVHDSVVNIIDLLRLRDITIGRPPTATGYELLEADMTQDGSVTGADLELLRDILLRKAGVPYLVDSTGGSVQGEGITLSIPPGAVDLSIVLSVRRNPESELVSRLGIDTREAAEDSAYFMAGFEITSSSLNFTLPVGMSIRLDSIPPCAYQGFNALFGATPDHDGDGKAELIMINELLVGSDSLTVTAKDIPIPSIESLSLSEAEPGQPLALHGSGFGRSIQNLDVEFLSMAGDSGRIVFPSYVDDTTVVLTVPALTTGDYQLTAKNLLAGIFSEPQSMTILPPSSSGLDIRATILEFYVNLAAALDSISDDSLYGAIEDTTVLNYLTDLRRRHRARIDSTIAFFTVIEDSLLDRFASLASFIVNMTDGGLAEVTAGGVQRGAYSVCPVCNAYKEEKTEAMESFATAVEQYHEFAAECARSRIYGECTPCEDAEAWRIMVLDLSDEVAALVELEDDCECRNCPVDPESQDCDACPDAVAVGWGPQAAKVKAEYGPDGFDTQGLCLNIIKYKRNQCAPTLIRWLPRSPVPTAPSPRLKCPASQEMPPQTTSTTVVTARAHPGSIVKVTNAPVPYNIVGILNDDGKAFIPHVPISTKVTFSIYDPVTGFYDPDAGTYTTGSTPGGFDRPLLLFQPNTTTRIVQIHLGDVIHDSVSSDYQRTDYMLTLGAADTGKLLNIGFQASAPLSFRIEDPEGDPVFHSIDTICCFTQLKIEKTGPYMFRVGYGMAMQPGSFTLGVNEAPASPIDRYYICGEFINDTLFLKYSPYLIDQPVRVGPADTVAVEAGVTIIFDSSGSVRSDGAFTGSGSPGKPIILRPVTPFRNTAATIRALKTPDAEGKEVQP